jgi:hypothetical protein
MEHYELTLTKQRLAKCGTFRADLIAEDVTPDPDESLPIHRRFFRPLLDVADSCTVYGLRRGSPLLNHCEAILRPERGRHLLDLSHEVVLGYEPLWNANAFARGSIVAVVKSSAFDRSILKHALRFLVIGNPGSIQTPAAVRQCRVAATAGNLAFSFSRHNSQNVQIYGPPLVLQRLYLSLPKSKRKN